MMFAGLAIPAITGWVVDEIDRRNEAAVLPLVGLLLLVALVEGGMAFLRRFTAARAAVGMEQDVRNALYAHLQRLPVAFHDGWQSGQLLSRAMGDISTIRRFVGFGAIFLVLNISQFVFASALMFRLNQGLALLTAMLGVPVALIAYHYNKRYHSVSRRVQDDQGDVATIVEESATGIRIIKAFGRGPFMSARFRRQALVLHDSSMMSVRLSAMFWSILHFLPGISAAIVVIVGGRAVIHGTMSLGELSAFVVYLRMLSWPIRSIGWILRQAQEARTGAERLFEVLDTEPEIKDAPNAVDLPAADGWIRLERVSFRYPGGRGDWILRDVDLELTPGETLALVGMTGSGKTTLASLVPRLYDVTEGRVLLDGMDVRDITLSSLRRHIGVAFEDPVLFSMSVRENLVLGRPDATEADIREALETANATFAYDLPWGLDTRVGEQGYTLSGGQRQRLALARAVLGRPQVLVLDDPLSSVDVHTEAQIEAALANVLHGVTALLVVHRPSTLALADRVALLHEGRIAATGSHHELLETVPIYRNILSQQAEEVSR